MTGRSSILLRALLAVTVCTVAWPARGDSPASPALASLQPQPAATAAAPAPACSVPAEFTQLSYPLPHVARLIAAGLPVKIIALGSSSTAGAGASSPAASYPNRLAVELAKKFPREKFVILNRGTNGEEARRMVVRLQTSLLAEKADLVLWQLGTNSVLRDHALEPVSSMVANGVALLQEAGSDVILIDPQFAPKVIAKRDAGNMVDLLEVAAETAHVNLFRRFALMRYWRERRGMDFALFLSPDQLHMNDWSYACLASALSTAIADAAKRPMASAAMQQTQQSPTP